MPRRLTYVLAAFAMAGTMAMGSASSVSAGNCQEYNAAIDYHSRRGNIAFALELGKLAEAEGCEVIRDRSPKVEDHRMIAE